MDLPLRAEIYVNSPTAHSGHAELRVYYCDPDVHSHREEVSDTGLLASPLSIVSVIPPRFQVQVGLCNRKHLNHDVSLIPARIILT